MKASAGGHSDVVQLLLSAGASLDEKNKVCCIVYDSMGSSLDVHILLDNHACTCTYLVLLLVEKKVLKLVCKNY